MNHGSVTASDRVLVLDGCAGAGKSKLATQLSEQHGLQTIHCPPTPDHQDLADRYRTLLDKPDRLVLDRSFLGELVYEPLKLGSSRLTWSQALDLAEAVTRQGGRFLHLTATPAVLRRRLLARDGRAPGIDELDALVTRYHQVFDALSTYAPVLTIDTSAHELHHAD